MLPELDLRPEENKALIPWRRPTMQPSAAIAVAGLLLAALADGYFLEGGDPGAYAGAALIVVILMTLAYLRMRSRRPMAGALAMDETGIVGRAVGLFHSGQTYVSWRHVQAVAHVHSMVGGSASPIEYNLLLYRRDKPPVRLSIPDMSGDERAEFLAILGSIARLHNIRMLDDRNDDDQRWLHRLPFG